MDETAFPARGKKGNHRKLASTKNQMETWKTISLKKEGNFGIWKNMTFE